MMSHKIRLFLKSIQQLVSRLLLQYIMMRFLAGNFQGFITLFSTIHALAFDPNQYPRKTVLCPATRRLPTPKQVQIELSISTVISSSVGDTDLIICPGYVDIGHPSQNTIMMVHGWPSIWSTWARQIAILQVNIRKKLHCSNGNRW